MSKSAQRRARRANAFVEHIDRKVLWSMHSGICGVCQEPVTLKEMTIDHWIPLSKNGVHSYDNCVPAHESCNLDKGNMLPDEYAELCELRSPTRVEVPKRRKQHYFNQPGLARVA